MTEDMRGLFVILKGQYRKGVGECVTNRVTGDTMWLGGYDPDSPDTEEWYMLMDRERYVGFCCGSSLEKCLQGVYNNIRKYKTRKRYMKVLDKIENGHQSPIMLEHYKIIDREFGFYYQDQIEEMEDKAYKDIKEDDPVLKARKRARRHSTLHLAKRDTTKTPETTPEVTLKHLSGKKKGLVLKKRKVAIEC